MSETPLSQLVLWVQPAIAAGWEQLAPERQAALTQELTRLLTSRLWPPHLPEGDEEVPCPRWSTLEHPWTPEEKAQYDAYHASRMRMMDRVNARLKALIDRPGAQDGPPEDHTPC